VQTGEGCQDTGPLLTRPLDWHGQSKHRSSAQIVKLNTWSLSHAIERYTRQFDDYSFCKIPCQNLDFLLPIEFGPPTCVCCVWHLVCISVLTCSTRSFNREDHVPPPALSVSASRHLLRCIPPGGLMWGKVGKELGMELEKGLGKE